MPLIIRTGVYLILNLANGKVYVGSASRSLKDRWKEHRNCLIGCRHFNKHLQAAWNKYGGSGFEFKVLERCLPEYCLEREQHWIDWYKSYDRNLGYNGRPKAANNLGKKFGPQSPELRAKKSESLKETYRKFPRPPVTPQTREKIGASQRGVAKSDKFKETIRQNPSPILNKRQRFCTSLEPVQYREGRSLIPSDFPKTMFTKGL